MTPKQRARLQAIRGLRPDMGEPLSGKDIRDLGTGDYCEIGDEVFRVRRVYRYLEVKWGDFRRRKRDYWITELELLSLHTGEATWVEWEIDDELEIYRTTEKLALRAIQHQGRALRAADLEAIAEEEEGAVQAGGRSWEYSEEDTWAARFFKVERPDDPVNVDEGAPLRVYEFESADGTGLSIEAWHEEPDEKPDREAFLSRRESADRIAVLQLG